MQNRNFTPKRILYEGQRTSSKWAKFRRDSVADSFRSKSHWSRSQKQIMLGQKMCYNLATVSI